MMSLPAEPPTPPTRTSETLRAELKEVNAHLDSMRRAWEDERRKLPRTLSSRLRPPIRTSNADIRRDVEDQVSTVVLPFQW